MEVTYFQKNLDKKEGQFFREYVEEKREAIEVLLTKFANDAHLLKVSIRKFEKHDAFSVEFYLILPARVILAKEASHTINKAVDLAKDRLIAQIKKHMSSLRKERSHKSIRNVRVRGRVLDYALQSVK